jgi:hypothetical protein
MSSNLSSCKERRILTNILPLDDTDGSVKNLTLFLPGLVFLQSPRTKYSIAWLEIFRPVTRHCHIWRTSMTLQKTSHQSDARQEDLQICTSQLYIDSSTPLQLHQQPTSNFSWSQKLENKGDNGYGQRAPRMYRTNPEYRALLGIVGTWSTSCDFCNCLLFALCVLDSVCSCLMCFLNVCCTLCSRFTWPLGLINPSGL